MKHEIRFDDLVWARPTRWLGIIVYAVLATLAAVFFVERMAVIDMAFQLFLILKDGAIQVQSGRFGVAFTQFFPWLAQELGLPLRAVMLSWSLGLILYYGALFGFTTIVFRQWRWGIVLILTYLSVTTHTFYWLSEMPQGLALLLAVWAWMFQVGDVRRIRWFQWPLFVASIVTVFYFHPLALYAWVFCGGYFLLRTESDAAFRRLASVSMGILALVAAIKYFVLPLDWYDAMSIQRAEAYAALWPDWLTIRSNRLLAQWLITDYYLVLLLWIAGWITLLIRRKWLSALWVGVFPLAYIILVNVPFHDGAPQFYLENLYLPLGVYVSVPFVFDVLPYWVGRPRPFFMAIGILALIRLGHIAAAHQTWSARVAWERALLAKTESLPRNQLVLSEKNVPMDLLRLSWAVTYECLILSSLDGPQSARCIMVDEQPERFDSLMNRPNLMLGEFKNYPFDRLPKRYFDPKNGAGYDYFR